jgi:hypothetical protein
MALLAATESGFASVTFLFFDFHGNPRYTSKINVFTKFRYKKRVYAPKSVEKNNNKEARA